MTQQATERSLQPFPADPAADPAPSGPRPPAGSAPPAWLRAAALGSAAGVLAFGLAGLVLAINGVYRPALALPFGALAWVVVMLVSRPAYASRGRATRAAHVYAAVGLAAIVAITAWNASHASQHVLLNRDGGSYLNTGRWLARDGSLAVKPRVGPFAHEPTVAFDSPAVYQMPDGNLQFQFAHLLPVVLAEAYAIGGERGLFHAPAVLGGIALLAFFVLAWRLFRRPFFALTAMLTLAFVIPQVWYSRDSYSEIPSQILLFTALWLAVSPLVMPRWRLAFVSGLFLGALEAVRIDAIVFLIGVPVLFAVAWLRTPVGERRVTARSIVAFVAGLVPGFTIGLVDVTRHSGNYFSDLSHNVKLLALAAVVSAIVCAVAVAVAPSLAPVARRLPWARLSALLGALVTVAGFVMWIVRPRVQHLHGSTTIPLVGGLQAAEHLTVDATRTYFERSFSWMGWYLGPLTLAVALVAAGFLVRELVSGRMARTIGALVVLVPGSLLYLYKADAVPDHVWVTRRFLVSAFPLLVLLAVGFASACSGIGVNRRARDAWRAGAVVFAVAAVAYPLSTVVPLRSMSEQRGFADVVHEACSGIGPHAAVVVLERDPNDSFDDAIPQTMRSFCGAEVGISRGTLHSEALVALARSWRAQGRTLYVAARSADVVKSLFSDTGFTTTREGVNVDALQQTLTHRPRKYVRQALSIVIEQVPLS